MKVTIIGAGISGLLSAYYLNRAGYEVEIFEQSDKPGGLIQTLDTPFGPMDFAASTLVNSIVFEELFETIGLEYAKKSSLAGIKNIYRKGMKRWPLGFFESLRFVTGIALVVLKKNKGLEKGRTIKDWGEETLGKAGYRYLLETFLQGVYAGDGARMSASLILGPMFTKKTKLAKPQLRGSVMPVGGMGQLISKLGEYLESNGVNINYSSPFRAGDVNPDRPTIIATSAIGAGNLLDQMGIAAGARLVAQEMLDLASIHLVFDNGETLFDGFGCLFPISEGFNCLGVLAGQNAFPNEYQYPVERWIVGGAHTPDILAMNDDELIELALEDRRKITGQDTYPNASYVLRRPGSLPHYTPELEQVFDSMVLPPNLHLVGNYVGGIGLTSIIRQCQNLINEIQPG